jgi:hypothetical protein
MTYFGGLGAGKGWLTFFFLVEPEILRDVLVAANAVLVVTNRRVPAAYKSTPKTEYLKAYERYVEATLESPTAARLASRDVYISLAASLKTFSPVVCSDARYKLMNAEEPVVNLSPEMLHYDESRGRLSTNVFSDDLYFGLQLSFPRVVSIDRDNHEVVSPTTDFATAAIYEDVKSRIQSVTLPCRIRSPSREHRTPIRITPTMGETMRNHPGLKQAGLKLV